jgi:uridine phosphorylase
MKRTPLSLVPLALLILVPLLGGCSGGENSLTGPTTGERALSGQVMPVGDLAGTSPAGITVTALGQAAVTGAAGRSALVDKVAVTDAAGRFAFTGLSTGNVPLAFSRGDGISAHLTVTASVATVVVDLQKGQATIHDGGQTMELEGPITAVSDTSITVMNASTAKPETAAITKSTVIRMGNTSLSAKDLKVGDRVHVKTSTNADGTLTATEIMLQNDGQTGGQTMELEGPVTAVSATSITVMNASTAKPETAAITKDTVIRMGNTPLTAKDLKVGDRVHVKTSANADGTLTATEIMLQNPA